MENRFTHLILVLMMISSSFTTNAASFILDGIKYSVIDTEKKEVEVAPYSVDGKSNYRGNIVIPATVVNENVTYTVTTIGEKAFYESYSLTSVTFPGTLKEIKRWCFYKCRGVKSFTLPESIEIVSEAAFHTCSGLTEMVLPSYLTTIGPMAFRDCSNITKINIPASVTTLVVDAFNGCNGLTAINVDPANTKCKSIEGVLFSKGGSGLWRYPAAKADRSYVIPSDVSEIGIKAFENCIYLEEIELPASVKTINTLSFNNCTMLNKINVYAEIPPICKITAGSASFTNVDKDKCFIYVPKDKKDIYTAASGWSDFNNIIEFTPTKLNIENKDGLNIEIQNNVITVRGNIDNLPVRVISLLGKVVYSGVSNNITLDSPGIYILTVGENKFKCYVK